MKLIEVRRWKVEDDGLNLFLLGMQTDDSLHVKEMYGTAFDTLYYMSQGMRHNFSDVW